MSAAADQVVDSANLRIAAIEVAEAVPMRERLTHVLQRSVGRRNGLKELQLAVCHARRSIQNFSRQEVQEAGSPRLRGALLSIHGNPLTVSDCNND